ncbi:MAG: fibrobacter succinogenes major paralogous domain-containing protein, partial [Alistipes sp.]|nr:fibrobacter succinogenes major paralogous domain-containing protein [Alistipes sp.]
LYDAATAFGVAEITAENAASFEGCQGICPDGWHIPPNAELPGLLGYNANGSLKDENAPYYDNGGNKNLALLDEAGFNWCFAGTVNQANATAKGSYLVTNYGDVWGAMTYVWGSTLHQVQTDNTSGALKNIQFYSFMSTYNASNNKVSIAYGNFKSGYSVRCIKNADGQ